MNRLYFGDNLDILRSKEVAPGSVQLIYLDPPFNSNADYNILFGTRRGGPSESQSHTFNDMWKWGLKAQRALDETAERHLEAGSLLDAFQKIFPRSNMMAYLSMMAVRLIEMRRVMRDTGLLYLHCDHTSSHYLKLLLDQIFGVRCFQAEILWQRTATHNDAKRWPWLTDSLLCYSKSDIFKWNPLYRQQTTEDIEKRYRHADASGRRYRLGPMDAPAGDGMSAINKLTGKPNGWYEWKG